MHLRSALPGLLAGLLLASSALAVPKALFDNTHAETAGNADWQIDTDQPVPVPAQSTVTWATPRTYWLGAISSWGIDLVKRGYQVATLTTAYGITYGNPANAYDLSKYDVFIVDEPNTRFTAAESTAIFNYVRDGGGLVAVCDHANSDRNGDGIDSPKAWGRLDRQHLWGAHFDSTGEANNNIVQDSGNVDTSPTNPIIHGVVGVADSLSFHNGTTMQLYPATNPNVHGDVWMIGLAHGNTGVMAAHSTYGSGRIFFVGDSSPCDDGSAAPGNSSIFDGWGEVSGRDSLLVMNGTIWATRAGDTTPPAAIGNLAASNATASSIQVSWTAPGDDGAAGTATTYDLRYSTALITAGNFAAATAVTGEPAPAAAGSAQQMTVTGLTAGTPYYFAIKTADEVPNWSAISNVPGLATLPPPDVTPPSVTVLAPNGGESWTVGTIHAITWSATDAGGVDSVGIDLSLHGVAGPWLPLQHGLANSGSWSWMVPNAPTDSAVVRVTAWDPSLNSGADLGDALFQIAPDVSGVPEAGPLAGRFVVSPPWPNPSRSAVTIRFELTRPGPVRVEIVDVAGRTVRHLESRGPLDAGLHGLNWDGLDNGGRATPPGVYYARVVTDEGQRGTRLVRVR